jgi:hypothetical protein
MRPEDLHSALHVQPFVPFRLHLTDGRSFDVPHPEFLMVTQRVVYVGVYPTRYANGMMIPEYTEPITLVQIVSLEPITQNA